MQVRGVSDARPPKPTRKAVGGVIAHTTSRAQLKYHAADSGRDAALGPRQFAPVRRRAARRRPRPGSVTSPHSSAPPCGGDATATAFSRDRNANLRSRSKPSGKGVRTREGEEVCVN